MPEGTDILAVDSGVVIEVYNDTDGYGKYVKIMHMWGESLYAHLSEQLVSVNDTVSGGQLIGKSGNTGNSTGPHLHFAMRLNPYSRSDGWDGFIDPSPYLPIGTTINVDTAQIVYTITLESDLDCIINVYTNRSFELIINDEEGTRYYP